jgi:hypothetical protein
MPNARSARGLHAGTVVHVKARGARGPLDGTIVGEPLVSKTGGYPLVNVCCYRRGSVYLVRTDDVRVMRRANARQKES